MSKLQAVHSLFQTDILKIGRRRLKTTLGKCPRRAANSICITQAQSDCMNAPRWPTIRVTRQTLQSLWGSAFASGATNKYIYIYIYIHTHVMHSSIINIITWIVVIIIWAATSWTLCSSMAFWYPTITTQLIYVYIYIYIYILRPYLYYLQFGRNTLLQHGLPEQN